MSDKEIALRLVLSALLGGLIGLERQMVRRNAGLRTHMLVSLGSCLIMLTSMDVFDIYSSKVAMDPSRIAAGVITGIGFLGAGAIMKEGVDRVMGLTTAASLWVVAAIGLAVGCGFTSAALLTTVLTLVVLFFLRYFEALCFDKRECRKGGEEDGI
jgi:putative Mg2+ transporter-C (MgtC) family protein